jgi:hypothetical protein
MSTSPFGSLYGGAVLLFFVLAFSVGGSARSFGRCNPGTPIGVERDLVRVFCNIKQREYE